MFRCGATVIASDPGGTSLRTTVPAPVYAPSPIVTGATKTLCDPVRTCEPTIVALLFTPS